MQRIFFLSLHRPERSPSQRFRFEQYLQFLNEQGFECAHLFLLDQKSDGYFYAKGGYFKKFLILAKSVVQLCQIIRRLKREDLIFVQREVFMLGTSYFEKRIAKKCKMIFDFDDSIWLQNVSDNNKHLSFLKNASKTSEIISVANMVFAGNNYLAEYARGFNANVKIIPTTIDTHFYHPDTTKRNKEKICIGWSGSVTTIQHFKILEPILIRLKNKFGDRICFKVIGSNHYENKALNIKGITWTMEDELDQLNSIDIGLMPLPDDQWANGKCGLKGLQFMALEIPVLMSPVGVNTDIIQHGINGFLPSTDLDWEDKISLLIESKDLREEIGRRGRQTVIKSYSVESQKGRYLEYLRALADNG